MVLIDFQPEQVARVQSSPIEEVMLNVKAVCKLARAYEVPVILSTVEEIERGRALLAFADAGGTE